MTETDTAERILRTAIEAAPGSRARVLSVRQIEAQSALAAEIEIDWLDPAGNRQTATAQVWAPIAALTAAEPSPLCHLAGYEMPDDTLAAQLAQGFVVSNPGKPPAGLEPVGLWNPLFRGPNFDYAVLHVARSLPFVDPARLVIAGGSAGGYAALMVGIETFPAAAVLADHPVVNLGHQAAFFVANLDLTASTDGEAAVFPVLRFIGPGAAEGYRLSYGSDPDADTYLAHSPVANAGLITADVHVVTSTADLLVPIDQIAPDHVQRPPSGSPEEGLVLDPARLGGDGVRTTLAHAVPGLVFSAQPPPAGAPRSNISMAASPPDPSTLPVLMADWPDSQWSVLVFDEGPPEPDLGHSKHIFKLERQQSRLARLLTAPPSRLTLAKVRQLLQRAGGEEWLCAEHRHLDFPEAEVADVRRGFDAYLRLEGAAETLAGIAAQLNPEERTRLDALTAPQALV